MKRRKKKRHHSLTKKSMQYETTKKVKEHLEWLGYAITDVTDAKGVVDGLEAAHPTNIDVVLGINNRGGIHLSFSMSATKEPSFTEDEQLRLLNEINVGTTITKWELLHRKSDPKRAYRVGTSVFGYDKQWFGAIMGEFNKEIDENIRKLIRPS